MCTTVQTQLCDDFIVLIIFILLVFIMAATLFNSFRRRCNRNVTIVWLIKNSAPYNSMTDALILSS